MSEDKKDRPEVGGLGSNDAPPSPFVSKKTGGELLEKLRTHSHGSPVAKPEIPTRSEREKGTPAADDADIRPSRRSASIISQMREESRVIDNAEKHAEEEPQKALVDLSEDEDESTALQNEEAADKPQDDNYDIRRVFGIPEEEKKNEEVDASDDELTLEKEDFVAAKEFSQLKKEFLVCIPKIVLCAILAIATFFFENAELLGIRNSVFIRISSDVRVCALAGIQFTLFAVAIMHKEMLYGLRSLFKFRAQPECLLPFLAFFMLIYQFVALFSGYNDFVPFNFLLFVSALLCLVSKWRDLSRRLHSLKIITSKSLKYSLVRMKKSESAPEREATSGIMDLSEDAKYIRVVKSKGITGYKTRSEGRMIYKRLSGVFLVASLVAAIVAFVITKGDGNFMESIHAAFSIMMFVTPFSLYTAFSYPLYKVSKRASRSGTAVIGDAASIEYSAPAFVTFNDTDVFTDKNVWLDEVAMKDSESFSKGLAYASVVFEPISGPLNRLFAGAADYEVTNETVEYIDISDDGIEAVVNRERVRIGQASYFAKFGYMLEDESARNFRIMYVEIGNVIALKVKIVYNIDKDFEKILQNLYKSGMGVVIRTSDPNINVNMIESIIGTGRFPIKVLKYRTEKEKDIAVEHSDGGIVSKGKVRPMLETLYRCDRAGAVVKSGLLLELIAFVIGIIVVALLASFGTLGQLSSIFVALYHIFWSVLIFILTLIFV